MLALSFFSSITSLVSHVDFSVIQRAVMHTMDIGLGGWI
jgi:hypothetical protein